MFDVSKIKGAIFDIDGTLLDSMPIWADICTRYLRSKGIGDIENNLDEKAYYMTFEEGCIYLKEHYSLKESLREIKNQISEMIRNFYYYDVQPKSGVIEFVNLLYDNNIPMVLATTGDEDLSSHALKRFGIFDKFSKLITCGSLNTTKSENRIFDEAKRVIEEVYSKADSNFGHEKAISLDYKDIFVFEDSLTAIRTTNRMGFSIIGIRDLYSQNDWEEIKNLSNMFIDSLKELL